MKTQHKKLYKTNQAIEIFLNRLQHQFLDQVLDVKLFGSQARGDHKKYSDIDLLIVVRQKDWNTWFAIQRLASEVSLEYDLLLSTFIMSHKHFEFLIQKHSHFIRQIHEQGKGLWVN
jgi:predicted nucleotidyltransferase